MTEIVQESEMASIRLIFERAANAIVQASELSVAVKELSDKVSHLVSDIEYAQAKNRELDAMLHDTREQRDRAQTEANEVKAKLYQAEKDRDNGNTERAMLEQSLAHANSELAKAQDEAQGWEQAALKADGEAQQAKAKLAKVQALFGAEPGPTTAQADPIPLSLPERMAQAAPIVTMNDPGFDWDKPYHYDSALGLHVQD